MFHFPLSFDKQVKPGFTNYRLYSQKNKNVRTHLKNMGAARLVENEMNGISVQAFWIKKNVTFIKRNRKTSISLFRFVGTVGHHEDHFPIEKLDVSAEGDTVASISHDQRVKFWNIK